MKQNKDKWKNEEIESIQIILIAIACVIGTIILTKFVEYIMVI